MFGRSRCKANLPLWGDEGVSRRCAATKPVKLLNKIRCVAFGALDVIHLCAKSLTSVACYKVVIPITIQLSVLNVANFQCVAPSFSTEFDKFVRTLLGSARLHRYIFCVSAMSVETMDIDCETASPNFVGFNMFNHGVLARAFITPTFSH